MEDRVWKAHMQRVSNIDLHSAINNDITHIFKDKELKAVATLKYKRKLLGENSARIENALLSQHGIIVRS